MTWKTVNAAQSTDAKSQNTFRRFSNILASHRNANGNIQYNPQDKSYRLVNDNGIFYSNGRFFSRYGAKGNYDVNTGNFLKKKVTGSSAPPKQQSPAVSKDIVSQVTNPNYLYGYKEQISKQNKTPANSSVDKPRAALAPKASASNSWINKSRGIWNYNGVSQADVANAYKTGDFSKVGNYLSQHKDLASYLNNVYSKRGGNQFNQSTLPTQQTAPTQKTPGYGIHVGNNGVTYTDKQGNTTDVTNSHNLSETIWGLNPTSEPSVNTQFLEQTASNLISPNQSHFGRKGTKDFMRQNLVNPEDYSTSERRAFRHSINNDQGDWSKANRIMSDARINNKLGQATGLNNYQLQKPQLNMPSQLNNNLVSLKFKQGGQMYKYQQGGQAPQANGQGIEQQAIALVQAAMQGDQQASQTIQQIMQAAQQGDQQAVQVAQLLQAVIQKMQGSRKARLGAKLNYFKQTDECPEGQELVYFKKGGEICKVCQGKKMQNGGKSNPVSDFRKRREQEQLKKNYQRNPATRGKSAKEIAEMQKRNRQEASQGKGESPANVAPWQYKKK